MISRRFGLSIFLFLAILLCTLALPLFEKQSPPITLAAPAYDPGELSYGLYWFGLNNANQKFVAGEENPYFDPAKPTLIFVHGWQPLLSGELPNFAFDGNDTAAGWINDGWNVGIFVWNQFSDEISGMTEAWTSDDFPPEGVRDAEAKIWSPNGPRAMRWRDHDNLLIPTIDNGYREAPAGTPSAGNLFYQAYTAALTDQTYTGGTIRIAGHSLGNQMAVRLTKLVHDGIAAGDIPETLRPTRVALLDPYWSPKPRTDITDSDVAGRKTGEVVREYIETLIPTGIRFEWYQSSEWTTPPEGDPNDALKPMTLYTEMDPAFETDQKDKHLAAQHLYFWSYSFAGPAACTGEDCLDMTKLLGKMSDDQLAAVLRSDYRWQQDGGQDTATPEDDTYTAVQQPGTPYESFQITADPPTQTVGGEVNVRVTAPGSLNGTLVSFSTDLGIIAPRVALNNGQATITMTSEISGTAHIGATTRGEDGTVESTALVTFTGSISPTTSIFQFSSSTYHVNEADNTAAITVTRSASTEEATVAFATSGGSAVAGSDYTAISGTLIFEAGVSTKNFSIPIIDDAKVEGAETVMLTLSDPQNGTLGTSNKATLIIVDDDETAPTPTQPTIQFSRDTYQVQEDTGSVPITVTLSTTATQDITVDYTTKPDTASAGSDYTAISGTLTFEAGGNTQTIVISIKNDAETETDETFFVTLSNPNNAILGTPAEAKVTIVDTIGVEPEQQSVYLPFVVR